MAEAEQLPAPATDSFAGEGAGAELREILSNNFARNAGQLMLLGLDEVREQVGEDVWLRLSRLLPLAVEQQLAKVLSDGDRVVQISSDCFLAIINSTDYDGACTMMREACEVLRGHFVGSQGMGRIKFKSVVSEMDGPHEVRRTAIMDPALEGTEIAPQAGSHGEAGPGGWAPLDQAGGEGGLSDSAYYVREADLSQIRLPKIRERKAEDRQSLIDGLSDNLCFLPGWDSQNGVLGTFMAGHWEVLRTGWIADTQWEEAGFSEAECAFGDTCVMRTCINLMEELYENNSALRLVVPMHYPTMMTKSGRALMADTVGRIPKRLKRFISIGLFHVPEDKDIRVLGDKLSVLRPHVASFMIFLDAWNHRTARLLACPQIQSAWLSLPMDAPGSERMLAELPDFVNTANRHRVTPGLLHVTTPAEVQQAQAAGITQFLGPAIGGPVEMPFNMIRCAGESLPFRP